MIPTLPVIAQDFHLDEATLALFRESLTRNDQQALDALFESAKKVCQPASQRTPDLPLELFLIALLIEQQKTLQFLISRLNYYDHKLYLRRVKNVPNDDLLSVVSRVDRKIQYGSGGWQG